MKRIVQHLTIGNWHLRKILGEHERAALTKAVHAAEQGSSGQIRVVIETSLNLGRLLGKQCARERALEVFAHERVWDTALNNGVLLYLLCAERDAEIIADRGLNDKVSNLEWATICESLEHEVQTAGFATALTQAIERIGTLLRRAFPSDRSLDELGDEITIR